MNKASNVDEYVAGAPNKARKPLKDLRRTVQKAAPQATEKLSYGMPYYSLNGRLVYFAAHREHIGFYPMKSGILAFKKELTDYETSKGTVRFLLDKPLPLSLIGKIVRFRVKENSQKKAK